jgi:hypothetical protein
MHRALFVSQSGREIFEFIQPKYFHFTDIFKQLPSKFNIYALFLHRCNFIIMLTLYFDLFVEKINELN